MVDHHDGARLDWVTATCRTIRDADVWIGETVLVGLDRPVTQQETGDALAAGDVVMKRTDEIWDVYSSRTGSALLEASRSTRPPHHTQVRWYSVAGHAVAQVAVYPAPLVEAGVRIWTDPALVVLFVDDAGAAAVLAKLRPLQPLWERLRGHHGAPLTSRPHPRLDAAYPVPSRPRPLDQRGWETLVEAISFIASEQAVDDVSHADTSPQAAVVRMMRARRDVQQHEVRLSAVLEHSHGTMLAKFEALQVRAAEELDEASAAHHVVQPHQHLMAAQQETLQDVRALSQRTSETANLLASAAVGRLLDKSEATQTAGTAVASALAAIALVSIVAALAAIPSERTVADYARLSGWVGFCGVVVTGVVVGLARLAYRSTSSVSHGQRRVLGALGVLAAVACPLLFLWGAVQQQVAVVGAGGAAALLAAGAYAYVNDFR